jgi:hypothetical protein
MANKAKFKIGDKFCSQANRSDIYEQGTIISSHFGMYSIEWSAGHPKISAMSKESVEILYEVRLNFEDMWQRVLNEN